MPSTAILSGGGDATLFVNLFIPSTAHWREQGLKAAIEGDYPFGERVTLRIDDAPRRPLTLALRLPGWCEAPELRLNGQSADFERRDGYARIARTWQAGDRIELDLPMRMRTEATPDDPNLVAYLHGPLVLAADLGTAAAAFDGPMPALVTADPASAPVAIDGARHRFRLIGARPEALELVPFFTQYDRRSAVYFPVFDEARWAVEEATFRAAERERVALEARTVDVLNLGEMQPERDHAFASNHSDLLSWGGRSGRQAWWGVGNFIEFTLAVRPGPMVLRALYWGEEVDKTFAVIVEGETVALERRPGPPVKAFVPVDYPIPERLTANKSAVKVRFETRGRDAPVYEARMLERE